MTVHGPGQFTGDVDVLTGRAALVTGRALEDGRVLAARARRSCGGRSTSCPSWARSSSRPSSCAGRCCSATASRASRSSARAFPRRAPAARLRHPQRDPVHVDRPRDRRAGRSDAAAVRRAGLGHADRDRPGRPVRSKPSLDEFARCAGLDVYAERGPRLRLIVVGAGPAGLAASVYAASEGLDVLTAEAAGGRRPGRHQLADRELSRLSGRHLGRGADPERAAPGAAVRRAHHRALPGPLTRHRRRRPDRHPEDGTRLRTRCVLVASGVEYRPARRAAVRRLRGAGIYYAATEMEARLCRGEDVVVVGARQFGGAGDRLSSRDQARQVHVVVRGDDLGASMSRYLVDRIERLRQRHDPLRRRGRRAWRATGIWRRCRHAADGGDLRRSTPARSSSSSAPTPNTELAPWLRRAGPQGLRADRAGTAARNGRERALDGGGPHPFLLETSLPGVFAAGDVRSGSVKRCASAVGEGAMAVSFVHAHLARAAA